MSQKFFAILTAAGEAKLANATALGTTVRITKMAVGDGNGAQTIPDRAQTTLKRETRRAPVNRVFVDPANPAQIVAEQVIPEVDGGWWIREIGLFDEGGVMIAVANCPDSYKPVLAEGSGRTQVIRVVLVVASADVVELRIDPSVVLATRAYADQLVGEHEAKTDPHPQYLTQAEGDSRYAFPTNVNAALAQKLGKAETAADSSKLGGQTPAHYATATALAEGLSRRVPFFTAGTTLPTSNIGPIWHDDYNSWMTWQVFTANGAAYTGYASVLVGGLLLDTQPTPRKGYVRSGVQNLSRATYAALRGWAMHNGIMVAQGVWAAGTIAVCDNSDGTTFRAYDVRGEFPRAWDDGRGVDAGRIFGSAQGDAIRNITGHLGYENAAAGAFSASRPEATGALGFIKYANVGSMMGDGNDAIGIKFDASMAVPTAAENRPRNIAMLASIKF